MQTTAPALPSAFSQAFPATLRTHLDAQIAFFSDLSGSLTRSFQSLCELNLQLSRTLLEEHGAAVQQLLGARSAADALGVAAARAQPASDKLRAYQQHIARIMADAQVELKRVTDQHVQETSRTASEVSRVASEETRVNIEKQQDNLKQFSAPFQTGNVMEAAASMQAAGLDTLAAAQAGIKEQAEGWQGSVQSEQVSKPA